MRIETELATYDGVKRDESGRIVCSECGSANKEEIRHLDAEDWFANEYRCIDCGNLITITIQREDMEDIMSRVTVPAHDTSAVPRGQSSPAQMAPERMALHLRYAKILRDCYNSLDFEPLAECLAEDVVYESQWVVDPWIGKAAALGHYCEIAEKVRNKGQTKGNLAYR